MYLTSIILLLLVFPAVSVVAEAWQSGSADIMSLVGKWFVFWGVGVRLFLAGVRQTMRPAFTARDIFGIADGAAFAIVRELGFANLSMGALGLLSLAKPGWVVPAAIVGGLYYGLAGFGHLVRRNRNADEQAALISDLLIFALLGVFVVSRVF